MKNRDGSPLPGHGPEPGPGRPFDLDAAVGEFRRAVAALISGDYVAANAALRKLRQDHRLHLALLEPSRRRYGGGAADDQDHDNQPHHGGPSR